VIETMLMPEVEARRALRGRRLRICLLAPHGAWLGCGALRVLRLKCHSDDSADLTVGYESYERIPDDRKAALPGGPTA
jgi:hypothetical protein